MADGPSVPGMQSGSQIIERKLATILSADVAEFSRLMNEDEEQTLRAFRGHKKVFESLVAMHHGRIFNTAGDAILAEFSSAVEAVRCATDVQSALRTRNDKMAPSRQVRFRIGINLGDVMIQGQDLLGDGVNVAARLQTAAEPGGICISGSVHDQIINKLTLSLHSLGERNYKNIPKPVRTFSIIESEDGKPLPQPKEAAPKMNPAVWVALAIIALGGIAYAVHLARQRVKIEITEAPTSADQRTAGTLTSTSAPASVQSASAPSAASAGASATPQPAPKPATASATTNATAATTPKPLLKPEMKSAAVATHAAAKAAGRYDGVYSGQVCYGKTPKLPEHCYDAKGTVRGDTISGKWPIGEEDVTMTLEGQVDSSGDVTILMHSERPDGTPVATINLTGSIHDSSLEASGKFVRGRPASLKWHLDSTKSQ
jgi:class 3 adenylate cyclase